MATLPVTSSFHDLIFHCFICLKSLSNIDGTTSPKLWIADCKHIVCNDHFSLSEITHTPTPSAPCPVCIKRHNIHEPRTLAAVNGLGSGEYNPILPSTYFAVPPFDPTKKHPNQDAINFQYLSLLQYGIEIRQKLWNAEVELEEFRQQRGADELDARGPRAKELDTVPRPFESRYEAPAAREIRKAVEADVSGVHRSEPDLQHGPSTNKKTTKLPTVDHDPIALLLGQESSESLYVREKFVEFLLGQRQAKETPQKPTQDSSRMRKTQEHGFPDSRRNPADQHHLSPQLPNVSNQRNGHYDDFNVHSDIGEQTSTIGLDSGRNVHVPPKHPAFSRQYPTSYETHYVPAPAAHSRIQEIPASPVQFSGGATMTRPFVGVGSKFHRQSYQPDFSTSTLERGIDESAMSRDHQRIRIQGQSIYQTPKSTTKPPSLPFSTPHRRKFPSPSGYHHSHFARAYASESDIRSKPAFANTKQQLRFPTTSRSKDGSFAIANMGETRIQTYNISYSHRKPPTWTTIAEQSSSKYLPQRSPVQGSANNWRGSFSTAERDRHWQNTANSPRPIASPFFKRRKTGVEPWSRERSATLSP